jgi:hypothetical protein
MAFHVPDGWESYFRQIKMCYEALIRERVIQGISPTTLGAWYNNFKTAEEKYFAAHLLDSFIFRSEPMLVAACRQIITKTLPQILTGLGCDFGSISDFLSAVQTNDHDKKIIFVPVTSTVPGKSSDAIIRLFKRANSIPDSKTKYPEDIPSLGEDLKYVVFIDDMCGTGRQFSKFYSKYQLASLANERKIEFIYIPFMAHLKGLKKLQRDCPNLHVHPLETLDIQHNFFHSAEGDVEPKLWFKDKVNTVDDVKVFYKSILKNYGIETITPFGDGKLGLTIYTCLSSPNNSLNIFYTDKSPKWVPLLAR